RTNKRMWTITKDLSFRATYFSRSFDRTEVIHAALQRPQLATPDLLQRLLDQGAHFSRYLAQMVVRYGNDMAISRVSDDASMLSDLLIMFRRSKRDSDWKLIEELFNKYNFMYYSRHDSNRINFVHQIAQEPRLAPLATKNGLRVSTDDCDTIMRNVFGDGVKTAEEKAASLSTFIESGLPGLHVSKTMAIKAILHQTGDVGSRLFESTAARSTSYRALKVLADSGKLKLNLSREVAELFIKKRFSRSCMAKLPYLNFVLEDFPEVIPLLPRKAALIKFLAHTDYSTDAARNKLHDALADVRPHLTQRLIVDLVANEFMTTAVPLQYARDFLPDDEVDAEVAAYEALRKCFWHPCKGASVLALYNFVADKKYFKQIMLEELHRWRFDLDQLQADDPDNRESDHREKRPVSLLAWNYAGAMMDVDACSDETTNDPYQLRRVGKFTDFPGETTEAERADDKGKGPALDKSAETSAGNDASTPGAEQSQPQQQAAISANSESELKEEPLPDKNPLYGNMTCAHSYHRAYDFAQCFSPLSIPLAEAVLEVFGAHSEAADIMYGHALLNGNGAIMDLYHSRMFYPSLMHLRLLLHVGRRLPDRFQSRLERAPFRKRPYGSIENEVRGRTKLESPFWCSTDKLPLTARPGSADATVNLERGDDYFGFGENESDDEELISWRRHTRGKHGVKKEGAESPGPSPRKRSSRTPRTGTKQDAAPFHAPLSATVTAPASVPTPTPAHATTIGDPATAPAPVATPAPATTIGDLAGAVFAQSASISTIAPPASAPCVAATAPVTAVATPASTSAPATAVAASTLPSAVEGATSNAGVAPPVTTTIATAEMQTGTSAAADVSIAVGDSSTASVGLNARGLPKRKAAAAVTYFADENSSDDIEVVAESEIQRRQVEAMTGVPPIRRGRGRPRKNPVPAQQQSPVKSPAKAKAAPARGKKRKIGQDDDAEFILLGVNEHEVKPVIPMPVFIGPNQLSSLQVLSLWESTAEIEVMWKWATFDRHSKVLAALDAWCRHIVIMMWAETKKHKVRKDKVKADAVGRTIPLYRLRVTKTEAHRCLESLQKRLETVAGQIAREMDLQRAQFLETIKYADGVASKIARQRQALVSRVRMQRAQVAERAAAAAAAAAAPPVVLGEGEGGSDGQDGVRMQVDGEPALGTALVAETTAPAAGSGDASTSSAMAVDIADTTAADGNSDAAAAEDATADTSTASAAKGKGKARAKGKGKEKEVSGPVADGDGTPASPSKGKGKGRAKAVGKGKGKAKQAPTQAQPEPQTQTQQSAAIPDDDDVDDGHLSDGSMSSLNSLDSAVDTNGRSKRRETGKTADEYAKNPGTSVLPSCGHAHCSNHHSSSHHSSSLASVYSAAANQTMLAAALTAGIMALASDEEDDYGFGLYGDEDDEDDHDDDDEDNSEDSEDYLYF
ncbi:unnamed protein product, partial [Tilletia caries]